MRLFLTTLVLLVLGVGHATAADTVVDVAHALDGWALGGVASFVEDPAGTLTIAELTRRADRFRPVGRAAPSFGLSRSTYWIRFRVVNSAALPRAWLLELAYPHLDEVVLYTPRADGGYTTQKVSNAEPFRTRSYAFYNLLFDNQEAAHGERTYYLRVRSRGSVSVPLRAWTTAAFHRHQLIEWAAYSMFYGALLMMAGHALVAYAFIRASENLWYAVYLFAVFAANFTLAGHTFQFLLPDHPALSHYIAPLTMEATYAAAVLMVRAQLNAHGPRPTLHVFAFSLSFFVLVLVVPYALAVRLIVVHSALLLPGAAYAVWHFARRGVKEVRLFVLSFVLPLAGALVTALHLGGVLPDHALTRWALQLGVLCQVVLISSSIADKLNVARDRLAVINGLHTQKVEALTVALSHATDASRGAERATALRDRFMATLNHEFRTPLNAIINIPAGLCEEFVHAEGALCTRCLARFALDPGEVIQPAARCPACGAPDALRDTPDQRFAGDPRRAKHLLERVQVSGDKLLRTVNGILQFSKLEAGHLELYPEPVSLARVVRDSVSRAGEHFLLQPERVEVSVPEGLTVWADDEKVRDILSYLLDNAAKFSDARSKVQIRAEQRDESCLVHVVDQGIGIAVDERERIFEAFEQASSGDKRRYGGTGLGLGICRSLVEAHGGKIWVESTLGEGSTFSFSLPCTARGSRAPRVSA